MVEVEDIEAWEERNGEIPARAFVLMHSGWDEYWGDNEKYVGTNDPQGDQRIPGFSKPAVDWLLDNRNILGIGVDTLACDSSANPWH